MMSLGVIYIRLRFANPGSLSLASSLVREYTFQVFMCTTTVKLGLLSDKQFVAYHL